MRVKERKTLQGSGELVQGGSVGVPDTVRVLIPRIDGNGFCSL